MAAVPSKRRRRRADGGGLAVSRVTAALVLPTLARASCPNYVDVPYCSGHGDCDSNSRCECWPGWTGGDCSLRTCAEGTAWADAALAEDRAHLPAECSNRGLCDRETGRCRCDAGFYGAACERLKCQGVDRADNPLPCTGHGVCRTVHDLAQGEWNDWSEQYAYEAPWDASMVQGCVCGPGYSGPACVTEECPTGDDPLTAGQVNEVQLLQCAGFGSFTVMWEGIESELIYDYTTAADLERILENLTPEIGDLVVSYTRNGAEDRTAALCYPFGSEEPAFNVAVIEFRTKFGLVSPLRPGLSQGIFVGHGLAKEDPGDIDLRSVDVDGANALLRTHTGDYVQAVQCTKEDGACANRGTCDGDKGTCECFTSNFELYGSSNLYGGPGLRGDCGLPLTDVTTCPGETPCSDNGYCRGFPYATWQEDATPFPTPEAPEARWHAQQPYECVCARSFREGDCSGRICARGPSWFSYPSADDLGHDALEECSGAGTCDSGVCDCPWPFTGAACDILACPGGKDTPCSGHGICATMRRLAFLASAGQDFAQDDYVRAQTQVGLVQRDRVVYGAYPNNGATWDADRVQGCFCDAGWTGYDCSLRTCRRGDDPKTRDQVNELQLFTCSKPTNLARAALPDSKVRLHFRGSRTAWLSTDATAAQVESALESLDTVGDVAVTFGRLQAADDDANAAPGHYETLCHAATEPSQAANVVSVQFLTNHGDLPEILWEFDVDSKITLPGQVAAYTDGLAVLDPTNQEIFSHRGTTESQECSGRGICDHKTGLCQCFHGFGMSDGRGGPGVFDDCGFQLPED